MSIDRRTLLAGGALVAANLCIGGAATAFAGTDSLLRPPSSQDEVLLHGSCLKCERCRSACPQNTIRTAALEDGLLNLRTPILDFHRGLCDFCGRCAAVCPTGTISAMSPSTNRIGVARVDQERCIAWSAGSACLVCVEVCPTDAISTDGSGRPVVDEALCNGCGSCEYHCPSNSFRAFAGGTLRGINVIPTPTNATPMDSEAIKEAWNA